MEERYTPWVYLRVWNSVTPWVYLWVWESVTPWVYLRGGWKACSTLLFLLPWVCRRHVQHCHSCSHRWWRGRHAAKSPSCSHRCGEHAAKSPLPLPGYSRFTVGGESEFLYNSAFCSGIVSLFSTVSRFTVGHVSHYFPFHCWSIVHHRASW